MALPNLSNPNAITTDGSTVNAAAWTTDWSSVVNYINTNLTASFNVFTNKGDIMCYNGSNIAALNASSVTNGWVLSANTSAANGIQWIAPPGLPLTTGGDTLYYNAGNQRLAIGTSGQVLTVAAGLPAWVNPAASIVTGMIVLWSGAINTIPAGWALCDGVSNASGINLQGLFVVGAGGTSPAATGGMGLMNPGGPFGDTSAGAGLGPTHDHNPTLASNAPPGSGGTLFWSYAGNAPSTLNPVTPRYYALCYIEKQ